MFKHKPSVFYPNALRVIKDNTYKNSFHLNRLASSSRHHYIIPCVLNSKINSIYVDFDIDFTQYFRKIKKRNKFNETLKL